MKETTQLFLLSLHFTLSLKKYNKCHYNEQFLFFSTVLGVLSCNMEQANFNFENVLSGISNIFKEVNEKAALAKQKNDERLQILKNDAKGKFHSLRSFQR